MHRLTSSFILGYHGCDQGVGERLLRGEPFKQSDNDYDWLGPGIYFWESNPQRGLEFAHESSRRTGTSIQEPIVIGAIIDLGLCLDLTTSAGIEWVRLAFQSLLAISQAAASELPANSGDKLRRRLDCAVITHLHGILKASGVPPVDTVRGVFTEGGPVYPGAGFETRTHIQVAVRDLACIKGVFRVLPQAHTR